MKNEFFSHGNIHLGCLVCTSVLLPVPVRFVLSISTWNWISSENVLLIIHALITAASERCEIQMMNIKWDINYFFPSFNTTMEKKKYQNKITKLVKFCMKSISPNFLLLPASFINIWINSTPYKRWIKSNRMKLVN